MGDGSYLFVFFPLVIGGGVLREWPHDPGRPAVPDVSYQLLRKNVIVRSLPSFFFHILDRNRHSLCSWNHTIKTYLWSQQDYIIFLGEWMPVEQHQRSWLCGILSSPFDFLMRIFGYCFFLIDCQLPIFLSLSGSCAEDFGHAEPTLSNNCLSSLAFSSFISDFIYYSVIFQIRLLPASQKNTSKPIPLACLIKDKFCFQINHSVEGHNFLLLNDQ